MPGVFEKPGYSRAAVSADRGSRNNIRRWIIAAAALPLMILAGILIKLELEKGQLVIESDIADVKVHIVSNGKTVSGLTIKHGAMATRLRADKYEIVIDGPSDGLTIENNQFTLQNGETVVARIHLNVAEESPSTPIAGNAMPSPVKAALSSEPLYEGKPLSEWLDLLGRERSTAGLKSAFDACSALVSPETSERITQTILSIVPQLPGDRNLVPGRNSQSSTLDREAARVLLKANRGAAYYELWVSEFEKADEAWRKRLWSYYEYDSPKNALSILPFVAWTERRLSQPWIESEFADTRKAADSLRLICRDIEDDPAFVNHVFLILRRIPQLKTEWWLSQPLVYRNTDPRSQETRDINLWPPALKSFMIGLAIQTIEQADSEPTLVAQACMILAHGAELNAEQRTRVLTAVNQRLVAACASRKAMSEIVKTAEAFSILSLPDLGQSNHQSIRFIPRDNESNSCLVLVLLDVVKGLNGAASVPDGLSAIAKGTEEHRKKLIDIPANPGRRYPLFDLCWPDMTAVDSNPQMNSMRMRQIWQEHTPTVQDWLADVIVQHPVMQHYLASMTKGAAVEVPSDQNQTASPMPAKEIRNPSSEPVEEGTPLPD